MKAKKKIIFWGTVIFLILSAFSWGLFVYFPENHHLQFTSNWLVCIATGFLVAALVECVNVQYIYNKELTILLKTNESLYYFAKQLEINTQKAIVDNKVISETWCDDFNDKLNSLGEKISMIDGELFYKDSKNKMLSEYQDIIRNSFSTFKVRKNELNIAWINARLAKPHEYFAANDLKDKLENIINFTREFSDMVNKIYISFVPKEKLGNWESKKAGATEMLNNYKEEDHQA